MRAYKQVVYSGLDAESYPVGNITQHASGHHSKVICACQVHIKKEANEVAVVIVADAVVHPRAVVV